MRILASVGFLGLIVATHVVQAQEVQLAGRFGYLGEWDVVATVMEGKAAASSAREFAGPVRMKHMAICGPGEVNEKSGHIRLSKVGRGVRYSAQLTLAGEQCSFSGTLSETAHSFVSCGGQGQIPLRLWIK